MNLNKISIIGVGGVGANVGFCLLQRLPPKELVLVDVNKDLACGVGLDLEDTRAFLDFSTKIKASSKLSLTKNSELVVITAGVARKQGMSRFDLLRINLRIVKEISSDIKRYAPDSIVIVVTNPLDFITFIAQKETGFSRRRVLGMGSSYG